MTIQTGQSLRLWIHPRCIGRTSGYAFSIFCENVHPELWTLIGSVCLIFEEKWENLQKRMSGWVCINGHLKFEGKMRVWRWEGLTSKCTATDQSSAIDSRSHSRVICQIWFTPQPTSCRRFGSPEYTWQLQWRCAKLFWWRRCNGRDCWWRIPVSPSRYSTRQ